MAVVVAMLAVAIASTAAVAMLDGQLLRTRAYENALARAQADAVAVAAARWAAAILADDDRTVDHAGEAWAQRAPVFLAERAQVAGAIADEHARFNLNNVVRGGTASPRDVLILQRLLQSLGLPLELADALVDWIDDDAVPSGNAGAEDAYYAGREPPYRPANRRLAELGELARVRGYTPQAVAALAPHVTALPVETRVNVNTASVRVLQAVVPSLGPDEAQHVLESRRSQPFRSREDFIRSLATPPAAPVDADLDVRSRWFSAEATVRLERAQARYRILLDRPELSGHPRIAAVVPQAF
jgi:general secretion pathway protein K